MANRKLWTQQEDEIILRLIHLHGPNQWTTIAAEMKTNISRSRTSKQIRERWYNQLSPAITKTPWSPKEETALFQAHARIGNKWKEIAGILSGRTDNAVKNHFYSTIRRALRRLDKNFGYKDSTRKMRDLKPSALTHFLEAAQNLPQYEDMMALIVQFAQWKPTRQNKNEFKEQPRQIYQNILGILSSYKESLPSKANCSRECLKDNRETEQSLTAGNESTESDQLSFDCEEGTGGSSARECMDECGSVNGSDCLGFGGSAEEPNYFGAQLQLHSWFDMNDKQEVIFGSNLKMCEDDHYD